MDKYHKRSNAETIFGTIPNTGKTARINQSEIEL